MELFFIIAAAVYFGLMAYHKPRELEKMLASILMFVWYSVCLILILALAAGSIYFIYGLITKEYEFKWWYALIIIVVGIAAEFLGQPQNIKNDD